jgi:hypothetical protein
VSLGRADRIEPLDAIAADARNTAQRMRRDVDHLGELAERAKHTLAHAADRAVDVGAKALEHVIETAAQRANVALEEFFGSVLGKPSASKAPATEAPRKALKP